MDDKTQAEVEFTYKQSGLFRVVKADGAWGGLTPRGDIQMAIFSERLAIPDSEIYEVNDGGPITRKSESRQTEGPIREVEVMLTFSLPVARSLSKWLADKSDELEAAIKEQMEQIRINAEAIKEQPTHVE